MRYVFVMLTLSVLWGQDGRAWPEWRQRLDDAIGLLDAGSPETAAAFARASESAGSVADGGLAKAVVASVSSMLLIRQERYREAEELLVASLAVFDRNPAAAIAEHVAALNNMAFLLRLTRRGDKELEYLALSAQRAEQMRPAKPIILVPILGNLAMRRVEGGDIDGTMSILEKARVYETDPSVAQHRYRIPLLNAASEVHLQRGEPKLAREKAALAVKIMERAGGGDEVELAGPLHQLARVEMDMGLLSAAERSWKRSLEIVRRRRGKDYPQVATVLVPLASLARLQGRMEEAEGMLQEAARIAELSRRPAVLAVVQHEMGKVYTDRKRYREAERLYRSSLAMTANAIGTRNSEYGVCLTDLAYSLAAQRKYVEAEKLLREAIRTKEEIGGASSFSLPLLLERHAELLERLKRKDEAKTVLARLQALRAAGAGDPGGNTIDILELRPRR